VFPIQPEPVPVAHLFKALGTAFSTEAEHRGLTVSVVTEPTVPAVVTVDADCLYNEILGNLMSNALKYTPRGGRIDVRVWGASNGHGPEISQLRMSVSDTGIGMPAEDLPLIFQPYYQGGGRRRRDSSGLGLAIVRLAVAAHDGAVSVDSTPGRGSTFYVTLPVAGPGKRTATPVPAQSSPVPA
jgi:two-component system, OmpR family, phosphate regulon sensor histidine kinase PhoR